MTSASTAASLLACPSWLRLDPTTRLNVPSHRSFKCHRRPSSAATFRLSRRPQLRQHQSAQDVNSTEQQQAMQQQQQAAPLRLERFHVDLVNSPFLPPATLRFRWRCVRHLVVALAQHPIRGWQVLWSAWSLEHGVQLASSGRDAARRWAKRVPTRCCRRCPWWGSRGPGAFDPLRRPMQVNMPAAAARMHPGTPPIYTGASATSTASTSASRFRLWLVPHRIPLALRHSTVRTLASRIVPVRRGA